MSVNVGDTIFRIYVIIILLIKSDIKQIRQISFQISYILSKFQEIALHRTLSNDWKIIFQINEVFPEEKCSYTPKRICHQVEGTAKKVPRGGKKRSLVGLDAVKVMLLIDFF